MRASITVTVLYFVYWIYVAIVSPLTTPVVQDEIPSAVARADAPFESDTVDVARKFLRHPSEAWAADAKFQPHLEKEGYVYFDDYMPIGDDGRKRVRITPFALVWFDPRRDDAVPYTVTCETAIIEFERKIDLGLTDSQDNRIVGSEFNGEVRVTGPDGLEFVGRDIALSEAGGDRGYLLSYRPFRFAYGPAAGQQEQVSGRADQFEITLTSGADSILGQDMPRISGIEKIVMRFNVALDLVLEDDGKLIPVSVRSDDRFDYDVGKLLARFDTNVLVSRPTHAAGRPEQFDRLNCDQLSLQFEPKQDPAPEWADAGAEGDAVFQTAGSRSASSRRQRAGIDLDLGLRSVLAIGQDSVLTSDENQLECRTDGLHYDIPSRTVHLRDDETVEVDFGSSHLSCPDIQFVHDEDSRIRSAQCLGAGRAWHTDAETGEWDVEASWSERLAMAEDPPTSWDLVELHGDARVVQHQQKMGLVGDVLSVWYDGRQMRSSEGRIRQSLAGDMEDGPLPLRRVVAEQTGNAPVMMVGPTFQLQIGRADIHFTEATPSHPRGPRRRDRDPLSRPAGGEGTEDPVFVAAGEVNAAISIDPATNQADVTELTATTDVRILRDGDEGKADDSGNAATAPFSVECETLGLRSDADGQVLRLQGAPAFIRLNDAETEIEGNDIRLNRTRNKAWVTGPGTIAVDMDRDFQGRTLEAHERLRVSWQEAMQFDGQLATFLGETKTTLADSVMKCHTMEVKLNRHISFTEDHPRTEEVGIATIHCRDGVTVEYHEFQDPRTIAVFRKMAVSEFTFDQTTGNFSALGPGEIHDWQRSDGRRRIPVAPQNRSRANQAVPADGLEWNYTWLKFDGEMTGNQNDRYVVLKDRVETLHGPVERALQTIERSNLDADTETAKNSVWLQSDQMNFRLRPGESAESEDDWLEVVAFGNAEMEGKVFRARANSISYDESKGLFTLKGQGRSEAGIWYQEAPGRPYREVQFETVHAIPSKNRYWGGGTTGIRFTPP